VRTLLDDVREAGEYRLTWDGRDQNGISAAPGMYFVRLTAGARSHTHRIIYVR
jgi:flagellar hook assembly protein FlgD